MHKSFSFNSIKKDWIYLLKGRSKVPFAPITRNLITVPGMDGAYLSSTNLQPLEIAQPVFFMVNDDVEALELKDELASWLFTKEPAPLQFDDESGRTYYAIVQNTLDDFEKMAELRQGTIQFLCLDPYSYGPEKILTFPSDIVTINNKGTAEADPIFEMTATKKTTFAMISNADDEYNLIGNPSDDDVQVVDEKISVLYEGGSTINTWQPATLVMVDTNFIDNVTDTMTTDGAGIRADGYGTGSLQHGPAVFKELPNAIKNFEIESTFDIISTRETENFRMGIYFHDENMKNLGHLGLKDNSRLYKLRVALGRVRPYRGGGLQNGNVIGDNDEIVNNARDTTMFYLRVKRVGQTYTFYIGEWQNQRHIRKWEGVFRDVNNAFQGKLKYITLFIGKYQDRPNPTRLRINSVEVFELQTVTQDQTPYILQAGDVVTFDHKDDDILVNGEPRNDLKNFGGSFFKLKKGENMLVVTPEDSFNTKVTFRDRYL